jgi:hypothetical protein
MGKLVNPLRFRPGDVRTRIRGFDLAASSAATAQKLAWALRGLTYHASSSLRRAQSVGTASLASPREWTKRDAGT